MEPFPPLQILGLWQAFVLSVQKSQLSTVLLLRRFITFFFKSCPRVELWAYFKPPACLALWIPQAWYSNLTFFIFLILGENAWEGKMFWIIFMWIVCVCVCVLGPSRKVTHNSLLTADLRHLGTFPGFMSTSFIYAHTTRETKLPCPSLDPRMSDQQWAEVLSSDLRVFLAQESIFVVISP